MASTLKTSAVASTVMARGGLGVTSKTATYTLSAALVVNDVIQMIKIPAGARIIETLLTSADLDSGGSPAIVLEVGDDGDTDRFIAASTIAQGGGVQRLNAHAGNGYTYTEANTIDVKVATAPATGATSGTITLTVTYDMQA